MRLGASTVLLASVAFVWARGAHGDEPGPHDAADLKRLKSMLFAEVVDHEGKTQPLRLDHLWNIRKSENGIDTEIVAFDDVLPVKLVGYRSPWLESIELRENSSLDQVVRGIADLLTTEFRKPLSYLLEHPEARLPKPRIKRAKRIGAAPEEPLDARPSDAPKEDSGFGLEVTDGKGGKTIVPLWRVKKLAHGGSEEGASANEPWVLVVSPEQPTGPELRLAGASIHPVTPWGNIGPLGEQTTEKNLAVAVAWQAHRATGVPLWELEATLTHALSSPTPLPKTPITKRGPERLAQLTSVVFVDGNNWHRSSTAANVVRLLRTPGSNPGTFTIVLNNGNTYQTSKVELLTPWHRWTIIPNYEFPDGENHSPRLEGELEKQIKALEKHTGRKLADLLAEHDGTGPPSPLLDQFASNLTTKARLHELDPVVGRDEEIDATIQVLLRRKKRNPLFVGEPGVGKTALAEAIAMAVVDGRLPDRGPQTPVFNLDLGSMLAGTRYRGEFEERLKGVIAELKQQPNAILFIDEMHTLVGAGKTGDGAMDASNLLKAELAGGGIQVIGATTPKELGSIEKDAALLRRFQPIEVLEPSVKHTIAVVKAQLPLYAKHHGVAFAKGVAEAVVRLSNRYLFGDAFPKQPDKALTVLDSAGAAVRLAARKKQVTVGDIEVRVSKLSGIPLPKIRQTESEKVLALEENLGKVIVAQRQPLKVVSDALIRWQAGFNGFNNPRRPIGSFLFLGPTGTGKTEVARQLAAHLFDDPEAMTRIDMSEYQERHEVAKLIGAPPGYIGYGEGGVLTEAVRKRPFQVILFDEIDKAHEDVLNILLGVTDAGRLTDGQRRTVDFRNTIIILSSNKGMKEVEAAIEKKLEVLDKREFAAGFMSQPIEKEKAEDEGQLIEKEAKKGFRRELWGRLQKAFFTRLTPEDVREIADRQIEARNTALFEEHRVRAEVTEAARAHLAKIGYDPEYGARPLEQALDEHYGTPLAKAKLAGKLTRQDALRLDFNGTELAWSKVEKPRLEGETRVPADKPVRKSSGRVIR